MSPHAHDILPQSSAVSALIRRIVWRLNAELVLNGHPILTERERSAFFTLPDASAILDGVAVLPGMAQHEERTRRDLLELYDLFNPGSPKEPPRTIYQAAIAHAQPRQPMTTDEANRRETLTWF